MPKYYILQNRAPVCAPVALYNLLQWFNKSNRINFNKLHQITEECQVDIYRTNGTEYKNVIAALKQYFPKASYIRKLTPSDVKKYVKNNKAILAFIEPEKGDDFKVGHVMPILGFNNGKFITPNGRSDELDYSCLEHYFKNRNVYGYVVDAQP